MLINTIELQGFASYKNYVKVAIGRGITGIVGSIDGVLENSNGCLVGDTIVPVRIGRKKRLHTLKELFKIQENMRSSGELKYIYVRSLKKDDSISSHKIQDVVFSGEKSVYKVTLGNRNSIVGTIDHKIKTDTGWEEIGQLGVARSAVRCDATTKTNYSLVTSVEFIGIEDTYDIICEEPYHNFVANNIVVHNSGKSKLVMGIPFALYGIGTYDKTEEIWNDSLGPKDDTFARINFDLIGNNYSVDRGKKNGTSYLEVLENGKRIGNSIQESQEFLNSLLGMDSKMFMSSVFFSQGDLSSFITASPGKRKEYIDSVLDIALWREVDKDSARCAKDTKSNVQDLTKKIDSESEAIKTNSKLISDITAELKQLPELKNLRHELTNKIASLKNSSAIQNTINGYKDFIKKLEDNKLQITRKKEELENQVVVLTDHHNEFIVDFEAYKSFNRQDTAKQITFLTTEIQSAEAYIAENTQLLMTVHKGIAKVKATLHSLEEERDAISIGVCPTCKQDVTADYANTQKNDIKSRIDALTPQLSDFVEKEKSITQGLEDRRIAVPKLRKELANIEKEISKFDQLKKEFDEEAISYANSKKRITQDIEGLDKQEEKISSDIELYTQKIQEEQSKLASFDGEDIISLSKRLNEVQEQISELDKKSGILQKAKEELTKIESSLQENKKLLEEAKINVNHLMVLNKAFKDIPANLFKESIGGIEQYANTILRSMLPQFKIKIYEDDSKKNHPVMIAFEVDGNYRNYKLLSGGQQTICSIGLRIGFNKIISQKAKTSLQFLVLDEIFGSLDDFNRAEVLKALNGLLSQFPQIIVITHTGEATLFQNTINVSMDSDSISTVV